MLLLESKILNSQNISSITKRFFSPEILAPPDKNQLIFKDITAFDISNELIRQNIDSPMGQLREDIEKKFVINNRLDSVNKIKSLPIRANFSGNVLTLKETSDAKKSFIKNPSILKLMVTKGVHRKESNGRYPNRERIGFEEIKKIKQIYKSRESKSS